MAKFHIGLITENKAIENDIKKACEQVGGAYVHQSKSILEFMQKLTLQKIQLIMVILPAKGEGSDYAPLHSFIRSKRDLQALPVCVMTENPKLEVSFLLRDPLVRSFPVAGGFFLPLISMTPMLEGQAEASSAVSEDWIRSEFLESLREPVGQNLKFEVREASDDERRAAFFAQQSGEVRTHLGWFKFTARLLETDTQTAGHLFQGLSRETAEATAQVLMDRVIENFNRKVMDDLGTRGAVSLPEREKLPMEDRKWISSQGKHRGVIFQAPECQVLLEISRYL